MQNKMILHTCVMMATSSVGELKTLECNDISIRKEVKQEIKKTRDNHWQKGCLPSKLWKDDK